MKKLTLVTLLSIGLAACTGDKNQIQRVLAAEGCTQVQLTGYEPLACSDSDSYSCGFTAVRNGLRVRGVVCSGAFKGATVRYF